MEFLFFETIIIIWSWSNTGSWILSHHIFVGNKAKGRISKGVFQENKARQIFRKTNFSYPLIRTRTCAYQGVRNVCVSENLTSIVFLKHPFLDLPFCITTDVLFKITLPLSLNLCWKRLVHSFKDNSLLGVFNIKIKKKYLNEYSSKIKKTQRCSQEPANN